MLWTGVQQDLKIFLLAPLMCAVFRAIFLRVYGPKEWTAEEKAALPECFRYAFWWGLDFNAYVFLASFLLVSLPAAFLPAYAAAADMVRTGLVTLYLFILYLAFIGKMIFYYHFHDTFNQTLRLGRHADKMNFVDIFFHQNHGALVLLSFIPYVALTLALASVVLSLPSLAAPALTGMAGTAGTVFLVLASVAFFYWLRYGGTFRHRLKPEWDEVPLIVKRDTLLGVAVRDDLVALELVFKLPIKAALEHSEEETRAALKPIYSGTLDKSLWANFRHEAKGPLLKARHIFYLLGESYTQELLEPEWRRLGLMEESHRLRAEAGVVALNNILSAGMISSTSLASQLTGVYDADFELNENKDFWERRPPTAMAAQLNLLGYRTAFWYGGGLSWGSLSHFIPACGFDEAYGGPEICPKDAPRTWLGIYDHLFLEEVARRIKAADDGLPQFHFVYTTSNHGPYNMPMRELGFKEEEVLRDAPTVFHELGGMLRRKLGGIWYSDSSLIKFMRQMRELYPDALFIVTGDHAGGLIESNLGFEGGLRPSPEMTLRESLLPACELYHRDLRPEMLKARIGSHMHLMPTIMELIAPKGFNYYSLEPPLTREIEHAVTPYCCLTEDGIGDYRSKIYEPMGTISVPQPKEHEKEILTEERDARIELTALLVRHPELMEKA